MAEVSTTKNSFMNSVNCKGPFTGTPAQGTLYNYKGTWYE